MTTTNSLNLPLPLTNGQLIVGSTGANSVAATLTAGTGITITNAAGSITVAANGSGTYPPTYHQGMPLASVNGQPKQLNIAAGTTKSYLGTYDIVFGSTKLLNFAASGAGGLDTGSVAQGIYAVYAIAKSSDGTVNTLASLAFPTPTTLPTGYDQYRRIGWATINAGTNVIIYAVTGKYNQKYYEYDDIYQASNLLLTSGTATTDTTVSCTAFVPSGCNEVVCTLLGAPNGVNGTVAYIKNDDYPNYNNNFQFDNISTAGRYGQLRFTLSAALAFTYKVQNLIGAGGALFVTLNGFTDYV